jgi:hypothetical protein
MAEPLRQTPEKLPIAALAEEAYRHVLARPKEAMEVAWPWLAGTAVAYYLIYRTTPAGDEAMSAISLPAFGNPLQSLAYILFFACAFAFLTKWLRYVGLGLAPHGVELVAIGQREARTALAVLGQALLAALPVGGAILLAKAMALLVGDAPETRQAMAGLAFIIGFPLAVYVWLRLSLSPCLAAFDIRGALSASWRLTHGRAGRILLLYLVTLVPSTFALMVVYMLLSIVVGAAEASQPGTPHFVLMGVFEGLGGFAVNAVMAGAMALAARHLLDREPIAPPLQPDQPPQD